MFTNMTIILYTHTKAVRVIQIKRQNLKLVDTLGFFKIHIYLQRSKVLISKSEGDFTDYTNSLAISNVQTIVMQCRTCLKKMQ